MEELRETYKTFFVIQETPVRGRRVCYNNEAIEKFTVRELLEEMEPLTRVDYSGKYGHLITEISKIQRQILGGFGVASPA